MVRDNKVSLLLNDNEYAELKKRAEEAHLPLAAYCRSFLLTERKEIAYISTSQGIDIKRLKKPEPPPDPYSEEKSMAYAIFKREVRDELSAIISRTDRLKPIDDDIMKDIKERSDARMLMVNQEKKNMEIGIY